MGIWQATTMVIFGVASVHAADPPKSFTWNPPKVERSMFTPELGMLDAEREEYATDLATHAANAIVASKASPQALAEGRQMLALAMHLSPRNKRALVVNYQLGKGILPEVAPSNYSPQVFARLLLSRGQLLEKQGGEDDKKLARMFVQLAANMDPKNEDAVYASEVHRLDHGSFDWSVVTDGPTKKPVETPRVVAPTPPLAPPARGGPR